MLIGRDDEWARITALLDAARGGRSGSLVLRGEAGIGKTALLERAAGTPHLVVLRAQGLETEAEIAFAGLHDLLGPIIEFRERLPAPQARALGSALSLDAGYPADHLAVCAGVLGLLAMASEERPLLAIVDDANVLDRASADAIAFAARRLRDERVAMLFAIRDDEPSAFTTDGIEELPLDRLGDLAASRLINDRRSALDPEARTRILKLAQGNPLALLELPDQAGAERDHGSREPAVQPRSLIARAFGGRIDRLPVASRNALTIAAASDDDDLPTILRAGRIAGLGPEAFAQAEAAGVISIGTERLTFRHPLVRAAAYAEATPAERRDAHRALAEALLDRPTEARWAWHRALAAVGPDETAAMALEAVARRSDSASASAQALEQAARLSADHASRTRRLIAAALAAEAAGRLRSAESLADDARRDALDAQQRAELDHLLGRIWSLEGDVARAVDILTTGAHSIALIDPDRAARMLADAVDVSIDDLDRAEPIAREAVALLGSDPTSEQLVMLRFGDVLGWRGDAPNAVKAWRRSAELADPDDPWSLRLGAEAWFSAGLDETAVRIARQGADLARGRGHLTALTQSLEFMALADARQGHLLDALDAATEGLDLVIALGQVRDERIASGTVAWIEGLLGRETPCRAHAERATELSARLGLPDPRRTGPGVLELALGRPDVATTTFLASVPDIDRIGADAIAPCSFVPSLVEGLVGSGRGAEAAPIAQAYGAVADRSGLAGPRALARRCRGLVAGSVEDLRAALEMHAATGNTYEVARTHLCIGQLLHRRGDRRVASSSLQAALEAFDTVGAIAWSERARAELEAVGATSHGRRPTASDELTPQERNVARLVAAGLTNREIAERLFVTTNTVETHLRHIFQKLDVTSRTQLAMSVAGRATASSVGP